MNLKQQIEEILEKEYGLKKKEEPLITKCREEWIKFLHAKWEESGMWILYPYFKEFSASGVITYFSNLFDKDMILNEKRKVVRTVLSQHHLRCSDNEIKDDIKKYMSMSLFDGDISY